MKKILIAPDSFKGSLRAVEAARAIERGVHRVLPHAATVLHPIADGGEGLVAVVTPVLRGTLVTTGVSGPLPGQRVNAQWGVSGDGRTAVIEMAAAAGLPLLPPAQRDPRKTTTYGVGELIRAALDRGVSTILLGIGGSATNDGGAGMAEALGVRFLNNDGGEIERGGEGLRELSRIDISGRETRLDGVDIRVACDVQNTLCGEEGASAVYGPQKGASPDDVRILDEALLHFGELVQSSLGIEVLNIAGGGAAGGLGAGLVAFCGATLSKGIDLVLDITHFDDQLRGADLVITGEGKIDRQVMFGKALAGVIKRSARAGVPVVAVVGTVDGEKRSFVMKDFLADLESLTGPDVTQEAALRDAAALVEKKTALLIQRYLSRT